MSSPAVGPERQVDPISVYFPDLIACHDVSSTLKVGWLEPGHEFPRGAVTAEFLDALFGYCGRHHVTYLGYHNCSLDACMSTGPTLGPPEIQRSGRRLKVGYSDFVVEYQGLFYYSPSLIYHYVADHQYLPPRIYREAVLAPQSTDVPNFYKRNSPAFVDFCERGKRAISRVAESFPTFDPALARTAQAVEAFGASVDLDDYVYNYREKKDLAPIRYAGYIHPCYPIEGRHGGNTSSRDPHRILRDRVTRLLLSDRRRLSTAPDELIADLFCASVQFSVVESCRVDDGLASETLRRRLYRTFVSAYQYPLGTDQSMPLESALESRPDPRAGTFGLLAGFEELAADHAVSTRAYANLAHWAGVLSDRWSRPNPLG